MKNRKLLFHLLIVLFLFILSLVILNKHRITNPYYFDEVSWICEGRVWVELTHGRLNSDVWTEDLVQRLNPQLGKYVLGWWMMQTYGEGGFHVFNCPGWGTLMHAKGFQDLSLIQKEVLISMRIPMMFAGVFSIIIFFALATLFLNPVAGVFSALLLLFNPLFQLNVNRAMPDSLLLFWFLFFILFIFLLYKSKHTLLLDFKPHISILFGMLIGIGVSIKTYGIYALLLIGGVCIAEYLQTIRKKNSLIPLIMAALNGIIICICTIVTIYILNPLFWFTPMKLIWWIPEWQGFQSWLQKDDWAYKDIALLTAFSRFKVLFAAFFYPGKWMNQLGHPIITFCLILIGLLVSIKKLLQKAILDRKGLVVIWFSVFFVVLLLYTPFSLERYYLPLLPPTLLILVYGVSVSFNRFKKVVSGKITL